MRLPQKAQYALLFILYLDRAGAARTQDVAATLNLSQTFVEQIAVKLRRAGLITVKRGPGGGYSIAEGKSPTVAQVLSAVGVGGFLTEGQVNGHAVRGTEGRALNHIIGLAAVSLATVFNRTVKEFNTALVRQETEQLNSLGDNATVS